MELYFKIYISRKSLHPRPRRGLSSRSGGNVDLILFGNYERKTNIESIGTQSIAISTHSKEYATLSDTEPLKKAKVIEKASKTKTDRSYALDKEETVPLKTVKFE